MTRINKRVVVTSLVLLVGSSVLFSSGTAFALTEDQVKAFQSGVRYFNTEVDDVVACAASAGLLAGNNNEEKIWNFLVSKGLSGPQAAGVMGNLKAESGENYDPGAEEQSGDGGFGIAQWTGGRRTSLEEAAKAKGVPVNDLAFQLDFLFEEASGRPVDNPRGQTPAAAMGAPNEWEGLKRMQDVSGSAQFWHAEFEVSNDSLERIQGRVTNGEDILKRLGSGAPASGGVTGGDAAACAGSGSGIVAGNILKTGLALAWPEGGHGNTCAAATPAFIAAHNQIYGPDDITHCTGCDVFLATVMRSTGIDPNYPLFQTSVQLQYVREHPEKYQILGETNGDTIDPKLQPGDILINGDIQTGHTLIFTGPQPSGFNMVDGSKDGHVPQPNNWGSGGWLGTYSIVRVIG